MSDQSQACGRLSLSNRRRERKQNTYIHRAFKHSSMASLQIRGYGAEVSSPFFMGWKENKTSPQSRGSVDVRLRPSRRLTNSIPHHASHIGFRSPRLDGWTIACRSVSLFSGQPHPHRTSTGCIRLFTLRTEQGIWSAPSTA